MVKKEISGYALSDKSKGGEIKGMFIDPYKVKNMKNRQDSENTATTSFSPRHLAFKPIKMPNSIMFPFYHFHTHPDASPPSDDDKNAARQNPDVDRFIINNRFQKLQYGQNGFFTKKK